MSEPTWLGEAQRGQKTRDVTNILGSSSMQLLYRQMKVHGGTDIECVPFGLQVASGDVSGTGFSHHHRSSIATTIYTLVCFSSRAQAHDKL